MMPMTPDNALYLAKLRAQDMLRQAEADRLYSEARRGLAHPAGHLLAPARAALAAIARVGRHQVTEPANLVEKAAGGSALPMAAPRAS